MIGMIPISMTIVYKLCVNPIKKEQALDVHCSFSQQQSIAY